MVEIEAVWKHWEGHFTNDNNWTNDPEYPNRCAIGQLFLPCVLDELGVGGIGNKDVFIMTNMVNLAYKKSPEALEYWLEKENLFFGDERIKMLSEIAKKKIKEPINIDSEMKDLATKISQTLIIRGIRVGNGV